MNYNYAQEQIAKEKKYTSLEADFRSLLHGISGAEVEIGVNYEKHKSYLSVGYIEGLLKNYFPLDGRVYD